MKKALKKEILQICRNKLSNHPMWGVSKQPKFHFSFIIQDNKIVAWSTNKPSYNLKGWPSYASLHSEQAAYNLAKGILNHRRKWNMINLRLNKIGELRLSAPCIHCQRFLIAVGPSAIHFTTNNGWARLDK